MTNRDACTRKYSLATVVAGTKSEDIIAVLQRIDEERRYAVKEVALDLSDSMRKIVVRTAFPKASRVMDRFHIQKLACDTVQELRIKRRWDAIQQANEEMEEANRMMKIMYRAPSVIPVRNCLTLPVFAFQVSRQMDRERNKEQQYQLRNILTLRGHMVVPFTTDDILENTIKDAARLAMSR